MWSGLAYLPPPQAVVTYFDSDASDVNEDLVSDVAELRREYRNNLTSLMLDLTTFVPFNALGGPTLYGELKRGTNHDDQKFEEYVQMNRDICKAETYTRAIINSQSLSLPHIH